MSRKHARPLQVTNLAAAVSSSVLRPWPIALVARIKAVGASLRILNMNLDTSTATGELILNVIGSAAQWERLRMLERQAEGIAAAVRRREDAF